MCIRWNIYVEVVVASSSIGPVVCAIVMNVFIKDIAWDRRCLARQVSALLGYNNVPVEWHVSLRWIECRHNLMILFSGMCMHSATFVWG